MRFTTPHQLRLRIAHPYDDRTVLQERVTSESGQEKWQDVPIYCESRKNYVSRLRG